MEYWYIIYALVVFQALYFLIRYTKTQVALLSPSAISALVLLIWFYPKIPDLVNNYFFSDVIIVGFLSFWLLCQSALFLGMNVRLPNRLQNISVKKKYHDSYRRWFLVLWFFFLIGFFAFYKYTQLPSDMLYMRQPSGIITILVFFSAFLTMSTYISAFLYIKTRHWLSLVPLLAGLLMYGYRIFVHGQRSELFEIMFLFAVIMIITLRRRVSVFALLFGGVLMIAFNATVSDYRHIMKKDTRDLSQLQGIPIVERIYEVAFRADSDIINAVATFQVRSSMRQSLLLGADYWNDIVKHYVPGQIVGANVKNALLIEASDALWLELRYTSATGTATFLPGGLFQNFGWLGFIPLFFYGAYMRYLFQGAKKGSIKYSVLYVYFGATIPIVLIFGLRWFIGNAIFWSPLIFLVDKFASRQTKSHLGVVKRHVTS